MKRKRQTLKIRNIRKKEKQTKKTKLNRKQKQHIIIYIKQPGKRRQKKQNCTHKGQRRRNRAKKRKAFASGN